MCLMIGYLIPKKLESFVVLNELPVDMYRYKRLGVTLPANVETTIIHQRNRQCTHDFSLPSFTTAE